MPLNQVTVQALPTVSVNPGTTVTQNAGHMGESLVSELHGKYYTATRAGRVFTATAAAVTVPVNAATLASVFSIWNPIGSGINVEILACDIAVVLATTVVNGVGLYFQGPLGVSPTLTTIGTPVCGLLGSTTVSGAKFYTALTHAGTPTLAALVGTFGATSTTAAARFGRDFDGSIILPPASVISLAMTTAASTGSGITAALSWAEYAI